MQYALKTSARDGSDVQVIPAASIEHARILDDAWTATWQCPNHEDGVTESNLALGRLVSIERDTMPVWTGVIWSHSISDTLQFSAVGWLELLKYRYILPPDVLTFTDEDVWDVSRDLIDYANAQEDLGITFGTTGTKGRLMTATYNWWDVRAITDLLDYVARISARGYDYWIDQDRKWWASIRPGTPNDAIGLDASNIESISWDETIDDTASQVFVQGAGSEDLTAYSLSSIDTDADTAYGLMHGIWERRGLANQTYLDEAAANFLSTQKTPQIQVRAALVSGAVDFEAINLSDLIAVDYDEGFKSLHGTYRVISDVTQITDAGRESRVLTLTSQDRMASP